MKLTDNEKRDIVKLIQEGKELPERFRFLLFKNSQQVELNWNGKSDDITSVELPFQIIEHVDEPRTEKVKIAQGSLFGGAKSSGWTNKLIWGDNKYVLSSLNNGVMREEIENEGGVKFIYIDPPFDVGADFSMEVKVGDSSYEKKPNVLEHIAYRDTWGLGEDSYLSMIYERLILMKELLAEDGTIYVHCDWRLNSKIRLLLDEIFGKDRFMAEFIWLYSGREMNKSKWNPKHDSILAYTKSENYTFNWEDVAEEPSPEVMKQYKNVDEDGKRFVIRSGQSKGLSKEGPDTYRQYYKPVPPRDYKYFSYISSSDEHTGYPTQKSEDLISHFIKASSNEGDIVADFFCGSGTIASVAEKLGRKWICSDLGKFSIHTCRKRMISVQREIKKQDKNWRAFEVLNLGKYQRQHFILDGKNERDEVKINIKNKKEKEFKKLILDAYKATEISGFKTIHGKKGDNLVSIGPINQPLSRNHVEEVIEECLKNKITIVDILGFEYEMGLFPTIQEEAKIKGLRLAYKQIPMEVFDKRAVSKGEIIFHDVAYIEFKPKIKGKKLSIELTDFAVFYNEENLNVDKDLSPGKSKIVVENGQIIEKKKDNKGIIKENIITKKWHDWIDYWSVDFDYESKPEIIKFKTKDGKTEEEWTGNYVFENEWQSFRGKKGNEKLELKSSEKEILTSKIKVAVKVVDIFGNDTMKVLQVKM